MTRCGLRLQKQDTLRKAVQRPVVMITWNELLPGGRECLSDRELSTIQDAEIQYYC